MDSKAERLTVVFRGVRGSHCAPGPAFDRYGGHTTCHEVLAGDRRLILDAGTGLIPLGGELCDCGAPTRAAMLLTHTHWDHLLGLPFFRPVYHTSTRLAIFGPGVPGRTLRTLLEMATEPAFHPVHFTAFGMTANVTDLAGGECLRWRAGEETPEPWPEGLTGQAAQPDDLVVRVLASPRHPMFGVLVYRIEWRGRAYVFATDIEGAAEGDPHLAAFAAGADLLAHDGQFTREDYEYGQPPKKGWGHSTPEMAIATARLAGAKRLAVIHHHPNADDDLLDAREAAARALFPNLFFARQDQRVEV